MRLVLISDTHNLHEKLALPDGDILVHAGDLTGMGSPAELERVAAWLARVKPRYRAVVLTAGNHDWGFEQDPEPSRAFFKDFIYLEDSGAVVEGKRFWAVPWTPRFYDWAFMLDPGPDLQAKYDLVPAGTQVLISHGPPSECRDMTARGVPAGSVELRNTILRLKPSLNLVVCGHIHEGYGRGEVAGVPVLNASICDAAYRPRHEPLVFDLD